jgi:hypothetical protein
LTADGAALAPKLKVPALVTEQADRAIAQQVAGYSFEKNGRSGEI